MYILYHSFGKNAIGKLHKLFIKYLCNLPIDSKIVPRRGFAARQINYPFRLGAGGRHPQGVGHMQGKEGYTLPTNDPDYCAKARVEGQGSEGIALFATAIHNAPTVGRGSRLKPLRYQ